MLSEKKATLQRCMTRSLSRSCRFWVKEPRYDSFLCSVFSWFLNSDRKITIISEVNFVFLLCKGRATVRFLLMSAGGEIGNEDDFIWCVSLCGLVYFGVSPTELEI